MTTRSRDLAPLLIAMLSLAVGCAGFNPANVPLEQYDPAQGYRFTDKSQHREAGDIVVYVAFSGDRRSRLFLQR